MTSFMILWLIPFISGCLWFIDIKVTFCLIFYFIFTDHSTLKKRFNNQFSLHFLYINFFYWSFWRTFFSLDTKKLFSNRRLDYFYFPVFVFVFSPLPKINTDCNCALHRNTLWLKIEIIQTTDEKSTIKYKNIFQAYLIGPTNT